MRFLFKLLISVLYLGQYCVASYSIRLKVLLWYTTLLWFMNNVLSWNAILRSLVEICRYYG